MSKLVLEGILLDKTRYKDKSLIIRVLTNEGHLYSGIYYERKGLISLQQLSFYEFVVSSSPGRDLRIFSDFHAILDGLLQIQPELMDQYFVVAELVKLVMTEEDPGHEMYSFFNVEFKYFSGEFNPDFHLLFLAKLITIYGYTPLHPYDGIYFDLREGFFCSTIPPHPDHCDAESVRGLFEFVNGSSDSLSFKNARERYFVFIHLLRFLELQKGIKLSLKSIEVLREMRD